jgi:hypothetical protein
MDDLNKRSEKKPKKRLERHGATSGGKVAPEYNAWFSMHKRCYKPYNHNYPLYGGRGITVCERWKDFANFLADMGERPSPLHSLDRIDPNGNYELGNCRWTDAKTQSNNRRNSIRVEYNGRCVTIEELSLLTGISKTTLYQRLYKSSDVQKLIRPLHKKAK